MLGSPIQRAEDECGGQVNGVGDEAGLSAALLVIGLFTVYFTVRMITRPIDAAAERSRR